MVLIENPELHFALNAVEQYIEAFTSDDIVNADDDGFISSLKSKFGRGMIDIDLTVNNPNPRLLLSNEISYRFLIKSWSEVPQKPFRFIENDLKVKIFTESNYLIVSFLDSDARDGDLIHTIIVRVFQEISGINTQNEKWNQAILEKAIPLFRSKKEKALALINQRRAKYLSIK